MKKIFKYLFSLLGYELKPRRRKLDLTGDRFQPMEKQFLNKTVCIHDIKTFKLAYFEIFEEEIYKFQTQKSNPLIIDCGANLGMSILYFKTLYPDSRIIAFEADNYIFGFLQRNLESYGFKEVMIINKAVWDKDTVLNFMPDGGAGGRLVENTANDKVIRVEAIRLRDYLNEEIDLLKMDIEGAEYEVLMDCKEVLRNINNIFIEYHSTKTKRQRLDEILSVLTNSGFRYYIKEAGSNKYPLIDHWPESDNDLQLNIYCYKQNS